MRTDSTRISEMAQAEAKAYIVENYGQEYYPAQANVYAAGKKAQDAHEAIRPSYIELAPDDIKDSLTAEQYKLYKLIWSRFMASQMSKAVYSSMSVAIDNGDYGFKAAGSKLIFDGFRKAYGAAKGEDEDKILM